MQGKLFDDETAKEPRRETFLHKLSPELQEYVGIAYDHGIGDAVRQVYIAALRHNLTFSPYHDSDGMPVLGIVPRDTTTNPILLRMQMKARNNQIRIYREMATISGVYRLTEDEVLQTLGSGWYEDSPRAITAFIESLDALFDLIEAHHGRQMTLIPMFFDEDNQLETDGQTQNQGETITRTYREGARLEVTLTRYERDPAARKACIAYHGATCAICDFNFGAKYGKIGEGFIIAHHKTPLSAQGEEHEVDPTTDMFPVCANCHIMLHQKEPPYTQEELEDVLKR